MFAATLFNYVHVFFTPFLQALKTFKVNPETSLGQAIFFIKQYEKNFLFESTVKIIQVETLRGNGSN